MLLSGRIYAVIYGCSSSPACSLLKKKKKNVIKVLSKWKPIKSLSPACTVVFNRIRRVRSDMQWRDLMVHELARRRQERASIPLPAVSLTLTNFDTRIPLWSLHALCWEPVWAPSENRLAYLKRKHACFTRLWRMCHVRGTVRLRPVLHGLVFPGKEIWC